MGSNLGSLKPDKWIHDKCQRIFKLRHTFLHRHLLTIKKKRSWIWNRTRGHHRNALVEKREGEINMIILQPQKTLNSLKIKKNFQIPELLSCAPNFLQPRTLWGHKIYSANYHSRHDSHIVFGCFYSLTEMISCGIRLSKVQNIYFVAFKKMLVIIGLYII